jgi:ABC-type multidrug transport system permease subunit
MAGVGFIFACYHLLVGEPASSTGNVIEFATLFLCAMFFPFQALPSPIRAISRLVPLSYCVDAFRSALLGFPPGFPELAPFEVELAIAAAFGILTPLFSYAVFRWTMDRMRKMGRLE